MKKLIKASASLAGPLSLIAGLISDFLSPLAPFSKWIFFISLACLLTFLFAFYFKKKSDSPDNIEKSIAFRGLSFSIISSAVFGIISILSLFVSDRGIIATTVPGLSDLQNSLFRIEKGVAQIETKIDDINKKLDLEFSNIESLIKESNPIANPKTPNDFIINAYLYKTSGNLLKSEESFMNFIRETKLEKYDIFKDYYEVLIANYGINKATEILVSTTDSSIAKAILLEYQYSGSEFQSRLAEVEPLDSLLKNWIATKNYFKVIEANYNSGRYLEKEYSSIHLIECDKMFKKEKSLGDNFTAIQQYFLNKSKTTSIWNDEWKSKNTILSTYRTPLENCKIYYDQLKVGFAKLDSTSLLKKKYPTLNEFVNFQLDNVLELNNKAKTIWWYYADNPINK